MKGKYGEPIDWDGMSAVFITLASTNSDDLSDSERSWLVALQELTPARSLRRRILREVDPQPSLLPAAVRELGEAVRTMLPTPVSGETVLVGGEPGEVIVQILADRIEVLEFSVEWVSEHEPATFGTVVASFTIDAKPEAIASAIAKARARRLTMFRWCPSCRSVQPPEWMMDESCMGCFEKAGGVF